MVLSSLVCPRSSLLTLRLCVPQEPFTSLLERFLKTQGKCLTDPPFSMPTFMAQWTTHNHFFAVCDTSHPSSRLQPQGCMIFMLKCVFTSAIHHSYTALTDRRIRALNTLSKRRERRHRFCPDGGHHNG